ncbi:MAG TPA: carboxypeptidase regulatory-like domain-containing protein [Thermoplasmata archaeon]|nr:carboxypeptidase regulatory-like domain-containing protein [Thermoplasmata archaeon]
MGVWEPRRTARWGIVRSWSATFAFAALLLLTSLLLPPLGNALPLGSSSQHSSVAHAATQSVATSKTAQRSEPGPFFGADPSTEPRTTEVPFPYTDATHHYPTLAVVERAQNSSGFLGDGASHSAASPTNTGGSSTALPPTPAPTASDLATASGTVECGAICLPPASPYSAISGALVTPYPVGAVCPNQTCPPVYSSTTGAFTVSVLEGSDQVQICAGYYVCNYTVLTNVTAGSSYSLGTLYLVPDGLVTGVVEGNDSTHEKVPGIQATGSTRDGKIIATPSVVTGSNGQFTVPVPPGPSEVNFQPLLRWGLYFGATIFVDVPPGQTLDVGVVELEVGVVVTVTPYDSVTGQPVPKYSGPDYPPPMWALTGCARNSPGLCFPQGQAEELGYPFRTIAPPGPDTISVESDGYITNVTNFWVPQEPPGTELNLGRVNIIPDIPTAVWANLTWSSAVATARSTWGTGLVDTSSCSLDGYQFGRSVLTPVGINLTTNTCIPGGCVDLNTEFTIAAAPLRTSIHIFPDDNPFCFIVPLWPIPGLLPVSDNWTWVNGTPGHQLNIHGLNLTPGTYVEGTVLPDKTDWTASACSTDSVSVCFPGSGNTTDANQGSVRDCPSSSQYVPSETFCVAVPPGPFQVKVTSPDFPANSTAGYNPPGVWNSLPLPMSQASANGIGVIRLAVGHLEGRVLDALTHRPIEGLTVVAAGPSGLATYPTTSTVASISTGYFYMDASPGWETILVRAPDYDTNGTTTYVPDALVDLGTIYLTPKSFIVGTVLGSNGYAINTTSAVICPLDNPGGCTTIIGGSITTTNGTYYQLVHAGHEPIGAYEVTANAPGYLSNSTWVNVTEPGTVVRADTIYLYPILGTPGRPHGLLHKSAGTATSAEWVYGRVVDNSTGQGLPNALIQVTPEGGGTASLLSGQITTTGYFNFSQSLGQYWINFTEPTFYYPASFFVVINGSSPAANLGVVRLAPLFYLAGRLEVLPWSQGVTIRLGVAPQSTVRVCVENLTVCGNSARVDSGGFFNVSAPTGRYDQVFATGLGTGTGTASLGFLNNRTYYNVTESPTGSPTNLVPFRMGQTIFATYTGMVRDASTHNKTPVRWGTVTLVSTPPTLGPTGAGETLTGGGGYTLFLPPGNISTAIIQGSAWVPERTNLTFPYDLNETLNRTPSVINVLPTVSLEHFGWLQFNVTGTVLPYGQNTSRIPFAIASAIVYTKNATEISSEPALADGWGFVNMSAPPGANVTLSVDGPDFNFTRVSNLSVGTSATTVIGGAVNTFDRIGNVSIIPWGWIAGVAWDPVNGSGVPLASITVVDNTSVGGTNGVVTNELGQYFSDLPLGNPIQLSVIAAGYKVNNSEVYAHPGQRNNQTVNLTGLGIVAGRVLGYPGLSALYQAYVSVCPVAFPQCTSSNTTTNGTGYFWVMAQPGSDVVNVTIPGYAVNGSLENLVVHSDAWEWAGTFVLSQYATVTGTVLGDPSGDPLDGANASVCSVLALPGQPTGPCFETVQTNAFGTFAISMPSGSYILAINATNYNASYLPISLTAGEVVSLGTIQLAEYGGLAGSVLGSDTDAPIAGTLVRACPTWSAGNCTALTPTSAAGRYDLTGPPGGYQLTASAPGYQDSYVAATMLSGQTTRVPALFLTPVGTDLLYSISGVVNGGAKLAALAGAVVSAGSNYATATNASGEYNLIVPWGTYYVSAEANGFTTEGRYLVVHANLTGEDFVLPQALYTLSGTTRDGLTGDLVPNVEIYSLGTLVATSDAYGTYSLALGNGSYTFTTLASGAFRAIYASATFSVSIQGASRVRNLQLFPVAAQVYGLVVNSQTGAPIPNATVVIVGSTQDSYPTSATYRTGPLGTFVAPIYVGAYSLNASAGGYSSTSTTLKPTTNATMPVTLSLTPVTAGGLGNGSGVGLAPILVVVGVAGLGVAVFVGLGRLRTAGSGSARGPGTSIKRI